MPSGRRVHFLPCALLAVVAGGVSISGVENNRRQWKVDPSTCGPPEPRDPAKDGEVPKLKDANLGRGLQVDPAETVQSFVEHATHVVHGAEINDVTALSQKCQDKYKDLSANGIRPEVIGPRLPAWDKVSTAAQMVAVPVLPKAPKMAYLFTVCNPSSMDMIVRNLKRLYTPEDSFLYLVDSSVSPAMPDQLLQRLTWELRQMAATMNLFDVNHDHAADAAKLAAGSFVQLGGQQSNIWVMPMQVHMRFFFFQRITVIHQGLNFLLNTTNVPNQWDFVVHLSESDYPLHSSKWIKEFLRTRRDINFVDAIPMPDPSWYWDNPAAKQMDGVGRIVFSCDDFTTATNPMLDFPQAEAQAKGVNWHHGGEWWLLTHEVAKYSVLQDEGVHNFNELVSMRWAADEVFWGTMLKSIPNFQQKVDGATRWYIRWGQGKTAHSPNTFEGPVMLAYLDDLKMHIREHLFIRKVDFHGSKDLLDWVDEHAAAEDTHLP